ncbi:cysteine/glutathione ABC transporter permease/ATP-binding protein CydD [Chimaeribacter californicus]|uniref:Cysteine/glutathione ABC transporter permease/ATP-binding protein CydD n=1 Tax=Chimaeribacter californicus TaxID=2060067 RepID=A0A2N5EGX0_9GAMM|nr:cysteine/glutathione ABC transporter permease/ATP-binding protein CydD [Chimaeribacter californicus]PLR41804.1 cysteine/glutathione ABC transporter permease/ATP-binding protein CydD [Chimaeribacter californicus]
MNKTRQHELLHWLRQQRAPARRWLQISMLLGVFSALLLLLQAALMATLLDALIVHAMPRESLLKLFVLLAIVFLLRGLLALMRERVGFQCGLQVRRQIRQTVLDRLEQLGPAWISGKPAGSWATLILEQIDDMQDYYARYLPQMFLAGIIPLLILIAIFPLNWAAGLILLVTAPLIPLFMALVGMGAADANRRNFAALARLSGNFLDSLRGLDTLRLFHRAEAERSAIRHASESFRARTMEVLRLAFLSSAVLEFFASVSIAVVAVYFGFSYLGELHFGSYGTGVTLFAGFLVLILAPEFFQPLRDLGTFYHAKAQAIGAAETLVTFLTQPPDALTPGQGNTPFSATAPVSLEAESLEILSPDGKVLAGPLNFRITAGQRIAIVGLSGAGKSSLLNALLGFLPYRGTLRVNQQALQTLEPLSWRRQLAWVGQNPHLPAATVRQNILLGNPEATAEALETAISRAYVDEFLPLLPDGLDTLIGDHAARLSVGQAQRVAVARALLAPGRLLLLDEPAASLDAHSEQRVMAALREAADHQTTLLVTHRLEDTRHCDEIWVMQHGQIAERGHYAQLCVQAGPFARLLAQRSGEL